MSERPSTVNTDTLFRGFENMPKALDRMGFPGLRKGQDVPIAQIMGCRDTICVLPTGSGKTGVFVLPTLALGWKTLVFSPLIALMRDQVQSLQRVGIRAAQMSSGQTDAENILAARLWQAGELDLFYVAPERVRNEIFAQAVAAQPPDFVVADEGHVCSSWSDNFRPSYALVGGFIRQYNPKVVAAFTATMPPEVEADIRRCFCLEDAERTVYYPRRNNLKLSGGQLTGIHDVVKDLQAIQGPCIVYGTTTDKGVEQRALILSDMLGEEVGIYHGKMKESAKRMNMDNFMESRTRIMCATSAFGMGIDKADVRGVICADMPRSCEDAAQQIGRAGRDEKTSFCKVYWDKNSRKTQEWFIDMGHPDRTSIESVYRAIVNMADGQNTLHASSDEIADASGVKGKFISACKSALIGSKVIEPIKMSSEEKTCMVVYKGSSEDPIFREWRQHIEYSGTDTGSGYIEIEQGLMESKLDTKLATIKKKFKEWDERGIATLIPPTRAAPVRIIGDISLVDFDRLRQKRLDSYEKLDKVQEFIEHPDKDKHAFLENMFGVTAPQE